MGSIPSCISETKGAKTKDVRVNMVTEAKNHKKNIRDWRFSSFSGMQKIWKQN
jgi:hypothetical protein